MGEFLISLLASFRALAIVLLLFEGAGGGGAVGTTPT